MTLLEKSREFHATAQRLEAAGGSYLAEIFRRLAVKALAEHESQKEAA